LLRKSDIPPKDANNLASTLHPPHTIIIEDEIHSKDLQNGIVTNLSYNTLQSGNQSHNTFNNLPPVPINRTVVALGNVQPTPFFEDLSFYSSHPNPQTHHQPNQNLEKTVVAID
jgi:hypothetical protein